MTILIYGIIVFFLIIILLLIKRIKYLSKYSIFLENEYYNFINLLIKSNDLEKKELLKKATKTSLYMKIGHDNGDMISNFIDNIDSNIYNINNVHNHRYNNKNRL